MAPKEVCMESGEAPAAPHGILVAIAAYKSNGKSKVPCNESKVRDGKSKVRDRKPKVRDRVESKAARRGEAEGGAGGCLARVPGPSTPS